MNGNGCVLLSQGHTAFGSASHFSDWDTDNTVADEASVEEKEPYQNLFNTSDADDTDATKTEEFSEDWWNIRLGPDRSSSKLRGPGAACEIKPRRAAFLIF